MDYANLRSKMTIIMSITLFNFCILMTTIMGETRNSIPSVPSVVNVGALFTMNSIIGRSTELAIASAIQDVNADSSLLPGTKLNLISQNASCTRFVGTIEALELMKKRIVAVIGPQSSGLAHVITEVANEVHVPLLSFGATDPTLSSVQYPYFIRTTQSDYFQMNAVADLVNYYAWKEVIAIYVDDDYGRNGISALGDALARKNAKISHKAPITPGSKKNEIINLLVQVKLMNSRVYVVHVSPDSGIDIFNLAKDLDMIKEGYVWIATDWISSVLDSSLGGVDQLELLRGVIALRHHTPDSATKKRRRNVNSYALYAYDSVWLLARALDVFIRQGRNITFSSDPKLRHTSGTLLPIFDQGQILLQILYTTNFTGISGQIQFDREKNLIHPAYDVINIDNTGSPRIGYWSNYSGLSVIPPESLYMNPANTATSNQRLNFVIWPGGGTKTPGGWVFVNDGKPLRVAVPYRVNFKQFVNADKHHTGLVTGYCIDVFEAAVKILPYPVHFTYMLYGDGLKNPAYNNMLTEIAQNKYDAGVGDFVITANRTRIVDFTEPYYESKLVIITSFKKVSTPTWAFLEPFSLGMWCVTVAAFLFLGIVIWILDHQVNQEFHGPPRKQFFTVLWFSFSTMVFSQRQDIVSTMGKLVMILWLFVVLIINSSYTASLSSILTAQQLKSRIEGIDSLKTSSDPIGVQVGSSVAKYLIDEFNIPESRLVQLGSTEQYAKALRQGPEGGGVAAIVDELPYVQSFLTSTNCEFKSAGQAFKGSGWGFVFQRDSRLAVDLSTATLTLSENGDLQRIHDKWFAQNHCTLQTDKDDTNHSKLSLQSFWGLFLVFGIACSLALIAFYCKRIKQYLKNGNHEKDEENVTVEPESDTHHTRSIRAPSFREHMEIKEMTDEKVVGQSSGMY